MFKNSVTGFVVSCLSIPVGVLAVTFAKDQSTLVWIFGAVVLGYTGLYKATKKRSNAKATSQTGDSGLQSESQSHKSSPVGYPQP